MSVNQAWGRELLLLWRTYEGYTLHNQPQGYRKKPVTASIAQQQEPGISKEAVHTCKAKESVV